MSSSLPNLDPALVNSLNLVVEASLARKFNMLTAFATAFIAQVGCPADEVELVEKVGNGEVAYFFRRRPREKSQEGV